MRITRVAVRYARTANLGNYESAKIECELEAELEPGEVAAAVRLELFAQAKAAVREQLVPLAKLRAEMVAEIIGTLPTEVQQAFKRSQNGGIDQRPVQRARG